MKSASELGLQTDFGIDYFADPLARLEANDEDDPVISTGWSTVDDVIGGGIGLQELVLFLAPSGGGKSVSMLNLAFNLLSQGYDGVYASFEMRDRKVARRTDQMIGQLASGMIDQNRTQVAHSIEKFHEKSGAAFFIKRFREGSNANEVHAWVRQLRSARKLEKGTKKKLGFIVCDYLDIMGAVQKGHGDSMFLKDKYVSEETRAIGFDEDCIMISGSQLEKGATDKINEGIKMHQGNVQGGSSKTNTADLMIATVKTDAMHEAGEYRFEFPKARNSDAGTKQVTMGWDKKSLRIYDLGSELQFKKKPTMQFQDGGVPGSPKKTLSDLTTKYK
jgi:replicative DNA helicase